MSQNAKMAEAHEADLQRRFGGRRTAGSGNQAANPMDGRHSRFREAVAFAWDGKSTLAKSISVSREMWKKAREQAHGERPMLALRFYDNLRLKVGIDLAAITTDDMEELLERSDRLGALEVAIERLADGEDVRQVFPDEPLYDGERHAIVAGLLKLAG